MYIISINKNNLQTLERDIQFVLRKFPCILGLFLNECLRFVLFEVFPQREIKAESLRPKHLLSLRHLILSQTVITAASRPPFNEQNKFWQLTSSLSPSNTSTFICWLVGSDCTSIPPSPPGVFVFVFVFIILQLSQMTVIFWIRRHLLALTRHYTAAERTFVCCLN